MDKSLAKFILQYIQFWITDCEIEVQMQFFIGSLFINWLIEMGDIFLKSYLRFTFSSDTPLRTVRLHLPVLKKTQHLISDFKDVGINYRDNFDWHGRVFPTDFRFSFFLQHFLLSGNNFAESFGSEKTVTNISKIRPELTEYRRIWLQVSKDPSCMHRDSNLSNS